MNPSAAAVLRDARRRSRLSQTDLARRAGISQSVVSAYESGHREPGLHTLTRLVEATGHRLEVGLVPVTGRSLGLPDSPLGRRLRRRRRAIVEVAEKHRAHNVRVFGSAARGDDAEASDVDLLVDLEDDVGLLTLIGLERELSELLDVQVDVVPADSLKPRIRSRVLAEAVPL